MPLQLLQWSIYHGRMCLAAGKASVRTRIVRPIVKIVCLAEFNRLAEMG
jgi:hypothetical protein